MPYVMHCCICKEDIPLTTKFIGCSPATMSEYGVIEPCYYGKYNGWYMCLDCLNSIRMKRGVKE